MAEYDQSQIYDDEILTVPDLCKIAKCDFKSDKQKKFIHDIVCFSFSVVLGAKEYKKQMKEA